LEDIWRDYVRFKEGIVWKPSWVRTHERWPRIRSIHINYNPNKCEDDCSLQLYQLFMAVTHQSVRTRLQSGAKSRIIWLILGDIVQYYDLTVNAVATKLTQ
jgi:hypothetical protein